MFVYVLLRKIFLTYILLVYVEPSSYNIRTLTRVVCSSERIRRIHRNYWLVVGRVPAVRLMGTRKVSLPTTQLVPGYVAINTRAGAEWKCQFCRFYARPHWMKFILTWTDTEMLTQTRQKFKIVHRKYIFTAWCIHSSTSYRRCADILTFWYMCVAGTSETVKCTILRSYLGQNMSYGQFKRQLKTFLFESELSTLHCDS